MAKDRKRKVQAQRKFAQGAYIPPSAERRTDTTPIKDTDHKRLAKNIIVNNVSAKNLLDVVSMHNLHTHGQPIVLVERMPGAPLNGVDKPLAVKTKETLEEPAMPVVNGHNETKEAKEIEHVAKCPKVPKKLKVSLKSSRDIMLLRSRSSKRRIIKKNEAKRVCTKKRPQPPSREATPKKKCTRNKSPGFSDDDDMPLNKITPTNNKDTSELERDDVPLNQINKTNTKVSKLLERDEVPMNKRTQINKTKVTKELEKDDLPLNKIAHINKTNSKVTKESEKGDVPTNKITHINSPNNKVSKQAGRDDVPANKITAINKITSKVANSSEKGNTPLNKTAHINKTHSKATKQVEKDDLPLSKMTNINKTNSKVKEIDKEKRNESNEDVNKKQFCTLRSAVGRSSVEDPPLPAKPTEPPAKSKELKIDLIQLPPPKQTSKSMDKTTVSDSAASPIPKPENSESYYGRNMIERWLVDATTSPPEADAARAPPTAPSTPAAVPEPHHFKVPQLLIKRTKVKPPEPRPAVEPGPTPNKHVPPINKKRDPTPCPSEKFYAAKNVQTATKSDLDSFCKKCITCRKLSMFVNLKPEKRTATRRQEPSDVYAFDDSEPPKEQLLGYNPKRLKTKDNKNMYLDLPQNSAHIVKLVEVKMPNQVKPIMRARLVPKTEVSQGETSEKEPVAPKKNGEMPHIALPANSNNSTNTVETDVSGEKSAKVSDTKPLSSYAKAKEATESGNLSGSSNTDINSAKTVEAPTFYPTEAEFENPIAYLEKITGIASEFGLCKIVPPPGFKPECHLDETVRFTATNQYLGKMFTRWGPASRELCAIKTHLATQKVLFSRAPLIDSMEVNLPKLYHIVQRMGGLRKVIEKEKWSKVAEELNYQKGNLVEKKLDQVYVKYLLPYDTLTNRERQNILSKVDRDWNKRYKRMLERARSPLHKQRQQLGECASASASDSDEDDPPPDEADDCVLRGRPMSMLTFEKVAKSVMQMQFPGAPAAGPSPEAVEEAYWRLVVSGSDHVCVNTAAVDTGARGLGFTKNKLEPGAKHPWNLKVLSNSPGSVLRSLGAVLSVTVPTLHLGMVFSTSCWHRDPHGLPWLEYHHAGPPKIWYGIPDEQSDRFRGAVEALCPAYCQNKSIWLPSDITMIPPHLLNQRDVALSRLLQRPGEFVVIFPKAYSCSICTGYTISESVYYAPTSWLNTVQNDFQMVRDSFEPTMFSLEQLLIALASDSRVALPALRVVQKTLEAVVDDELARRRALRKRGIPVNEMKHPPKKKAAAWNVRELDECDICRTTLYLSKVSGLVDKRGAHCPQHALKVLQRERDAVDATLECFYSEDALQSVLAKLRRRLT